MVNAIAQDDHGRLWVGMQYGLVSIDIATDTITWHDELTAALGSADQVIAITSVMADNKGRIWCGTDKNGVVVYTPETNTVRWLKHNPSRAQSLPSSIAYDIAQTPDGKIWIATTDGLALWQEATGEFIVHRPEDESGPLGLNVMVRIQPDDSGLLWLGSAAGLYVFDPVTLRFRLFTHDRTKPSSPVNGPVLSLMFDRSGILWAGSWHVGLNKVNPKGGGFHLQSFALEEGKPGGTGVESILEDSHGALWVGVSDIPRGWGRGGLFRREAPGEPFKRVPVDGRGKELTSVLRLAQDLEGSIWVGTFAGLWKVENGRLAPRTPKAKDVATQTILTESNLKPFLVDRERNIWLGTMSSGLFRWNPATEDLTHFTHKILDPHSLS